MLGRLCGGRRHQTLSRYFLEYEEDLLRIVVLSDGSIGIELTELRCLLLSSLIHFFYNVFVSGETWNDTFNMDSFQVHRGRVRIKENPHVVLNKDTLHRHRIRFSETIKTMFVWDGVYPPYLQHLLQGYGFPVSLPMCPFVSPTQSTMLLAAKSGPPWSPITRIKIEFATIAKL